MPEHGSPSDNQKHDRSFWLRISKHKVGNIDTTLIGSQNYGIPSHEIAIIVEAWLESLKEQLKQPIKDSLHNPKK